jgi:hypothetical protein
MDARQEAAAFISQMDAPVEATVEPVAEVADDQVSEGSTEPEDVIEDESPGSDEPEALEASDDEQADEAEANPVDAPNWWDAEAKGRFADLPPDVQAIVRAQEDKREAITQKAKQEAAEARKGFEARAAEISALADKVGAIIPQAEAAFTDRWAGATPDFWLELSQTDPTTYVQLKAEFDADKLRLEVLRDANQETQKVSQEQHFKTQAARLAEIDPVLVSDPKRLQAVGEYIIKSGIPAEQIALASAEELSIVHKAMMWDQSQSKVREAVTKPDALKRVPSKSVSPTARVPVQPPQQREIQQKINRFNQTKSREDLHALIKSGVFG